ncbi:MAG: hypothetical protein MSA48_09825 [Bacteroides sp.]|nr:hypothetical protein [Bacteroides sp.]
MAKKSAIYGEYVVSVKDDGSIEVFRIYDNVKGSLREIAESKGFEYDPSWSTQQFGARLIKEFGEGSEAHVDNYMIVKNDNGHIDTYRTYENTKEALRSISSATGFELDSNWTTRQIGSKLIEFLNNK